VPKDENKQVWLQLLPKDPNAVNPAERKSIAENGEVVDSPTFGVGCKAWTHPSGLKDPQKQDSGELWSDGSLSTDDAEGAFVNYQFSQDWCFVGLETACPYVGRMIARQGRSAVTPDGKLENVEVLLYYSWWPCRFTEHATERKDSQEWAWKSQAESTCTILWIATVVNVIILLLLQWMRQSVLSMFIRQQCFDSSVLQADGPMLQTAAAEDLWGDSDDDFDDGVDDDDDDFEGKSGDSD